MKIRVCQLRPRLGDIENRIQMALRKLGHLEMMLLFQNFLVGYPPTDEWFNMDAHNKLKLLSMP